jgi:hypothetical protein
LGEEHHQGEEQELLVGHYGFDERRTIKEGRFRREEGCFGGGEVESFEVWLGVGDDVDS